MFARRIRLSELATLCRSLGTLLHSGVRLLEALKTLEQQHRGLTVAVLRQRLLGQAALLSDMQHQSLTSAVLQQIGRDVRKGMDLAEAFREHGTYFPELMIDMIGVAEQTGALPEVLAGLADHYDNLLRLRRTFLGAIAWPVIQLFAAIFIVAGLILVLGWIAGANPGSAPFDPLGFGLLGETGALVWLGMCFGTLGAIYVAYRLALASAAQAKVLHHVLLAVPVVGHCLRSFAIARFSWSYALTQQAGMNVPDSLTASLKATNNAAFEAASPHVVAAVMAGEDLTTALQSTDLFPRSFIEMVRVGEQTGTVPEALERLSPQFEEDARRALMGLTVAMGWVIWSLVAAMIIFIIFRIILSYVDMINRAASGQF